MNKPLYYYPKEHISLSSLQAFEKCPFSFYMKYYLEVRGPEKERATVGKQFQDALNAKYKGEDASPFIDLIAVKSRGVAALLLAKAYDFSSEGIISMDEPHLVDLGFDIPIMFVPDLLTHRGVTENKYTTGYYNSRSVLKERQPILYYVGTRVKFGFEPLVRYQLFNTKNKSVELVEITPTPQDIDSLMDWINNSLKQIEKCYNTGVWDNGTHSFCEFPNTCPLNEKYPSMKYGR